MICGHFKFLNKIAVHTSPNYLNVSYNHSKDINEIGNCSVIFLCHCSLNSDKSYFSDLCLLLKFELVCFFHSKEVLKIMLTSFAAHRPQDIVKDNT